MTCSPQTFRIRIGTYNIDRMNYRKKCIELAPGLKKSPQSNKLCFSLILTTYCILALSLPAHIQHHGPSAKAPPLGTPACSRPIYSPYLSLTCGLPWRTSTRTPASPSLSSPWLPAQCRLVSVGNQRECSCIILPKYDLQVLLHSLFSMITNFQSKFTYGNRRSSGIKIAHWNKGNSFLINKMTEVRSIVEKHQPHILGLSEANLLATHDRSLVVLRVCHTIKNPLLATSRVVVYTQTRSHG